MNLIEIILYKNGFNGKILCYVYYIYYCKNIKKDGFN